MKFVKPRNLKPCPLCGTKAILAIHCEGSPVNVSCGVKDDESDSCGLVLFGNNGSTRKSMIEKWNERTKEVHAPKKQEIDPEIYRDAT